MIYFSKMNMLYLRIPKTGSTAFAAFLIENFYNSKDNNVLVDIPYTLNGKLIFSSDPSNPHPGLQYAIDHDILLREDLHTTNVFAFVRNPLEKQLGLYLNRISRTEGYSKANPAEFRSLLKNGKGYISDHNPRHSVPQHTFFEVDGEMHGTPYSYNSIDLVAADFLLKSEKKIPLKKINVTDKPRSTADLMEEYYDHKTYSFMRDVHEKDFELFELAEKNSKKMN